MAKLTADNYRPFVLEGTRTMKVATVRPDGRPHVAPVWFLLDGDAILFTTSAGSIKGQDIQRAPAVSLLVENEAPPFGYALIEGTASVSRDREEQLQWNTRLAQRYVGPSKAEKVGQLNTGDDTLLVRVIPTHISGYDVIAED